MPIVKKEKKKKKVKQNSTIFTSIIDALVNDGYIIINNTLDPQLPKNLKETAKEQTNFKQAGISASSQVHIDSGRRRDKISWLNEDDSYQSQYLEFTQELQQRLNRELYLGLNDYESHFAIYEKGDFYETHLDAFKGSKNRIVTTVYYLNDDWDVNDGGELIIYDENNNQIKKVLPHANTLVVFLSDKFPHEVLPAKKKRFSIAGWFRIDK